MKTDDMIRAVQKKLGIDVDGRPGPQTWGAIYQYIVRPEAEPAIAFTGPKDKANERSEKVIDTLLPEVRPYARALFFKARDKGIAINIISGTRTFEEQDRLYAKGRSTSGPRVTNARGGYSNHNFGIAFDIGVFSGNRYLPDSPLYKAVGALGMELGLDWGGNWKSIVDQPHFELRPAWAGDMSESRMLAELRSRRERGEAIA
jgi:peptidoglycan L-alanyl-D-glutamate endopeptidase CwlK